MNWKAIVIHHSATEDDGIKNDWESICRYHTSWRLNGEIIMSAEGKQLLAEGKPVIRPWRAVGYHWGIESVKGQVVIKKGRSLNQLGAHCIGMNSQAIGICCVGDFDKHVPSEAIYFNCAHLCTQMIKLFPRITAWSIYPHNKFSPKSCPGLLFNMNRLIESVRTWK